MNCVRLPTGCFRAGYAFGEMGPIQCSFSVHSELSRSLRDVDMVRQPYI